MVPVNRFPEGLLSSELLDEHHEAAAPKAKPSCGPLGPSSVRPLRALLSSTLQQLLTKGQELFPERFARTQEKANRDESAR